MTSAKLRKIHPENIYIEAMKYKNSIKEKSVTITAISKKLGIPRCTLSAWYHGRQPFFKFTSSRKNVLKLISRPAKNISSEKAYILGVICGDGYVNYRDHYVMLETIDKKFLEIFRKCFIKVYGGHFRGRITPTCNSKYRIVICGKMITDDIRRYLPKQSSFEWRAPVQIVKSNQKCKAGFLRGFFDSEGTVCKRFSLNFWSSNIEGLNQIKELLKDLNIMSSDIKPYNGGNCNRLYVTSKENIVRFIKLIGTNIPYKYDKMKYLLNRYGLTPP